MSEFASGSGSGSGLNKVPVENLVLGMYVAGLDRPWLESSRPLQGFYLDSTEAIHKLATECSYVYVDPRRYDTGLVTASVVGRTAKKSRVVQLDSVRPNSPKIYSDTTSVDDEMVPAQTSLDDAIETMKSIVGKLRNTGSINLEEIELAIQPLVNSVMRNKMAIVALLRMRTLGSYSYTHALSCAVWTALLARELGFSRKDINSLALGCALMDIGNLQLPAKIIDSVEPLTPELWEIMKSHVDEGVKMAREAGLVDERILQMLQTHHERHDGSGYPNGLTNNEIPIFGRIAGVVDSYDAMISERPYAKTRSSFEAIQELQSHTHDLYQKEIVEHFIKAIGIFPVGTVVELNTGAVGVVVLQNEVLRLKPKIVLIMDENKDIKEQLVVIDLANSVEFGGPTIWITKELPTNAYGIDPRKYFL